MAVASVMTHADTCPLNLGMDRVCDDAWFDTHPDAVVRTRPVSPADVADLLARGLPRPRGTVTVRRRLRSADRVFWTEPGETADHPLPYCLICGADAVASRITHTDTCPLARALGQVFDEDDAWFDAHPGATVRHRPTAPAEAAMGAALDWGTPPEGDHQIVTRGPR